MSKSEEILISVIIPALNEEKLIRQSLAQFTPEIRSKFSVEVVVSDGGSSDATRDIASSLADKVVNSPAGEKQNIAKGRNLGASAASGRFLYLMNADTLIADIDNFFERTIRAFENPKYAALTCRVKVFPSEQETIDRVFHFCYNNYVKILNALGMGMGRGECHMIRSELFRTLGGYNEQMAAGEDFDLYRRISKNGKIRYISDITIYESPRRYRKFGYARVFWDWTKNALSVVIKNKAISKVWEPVR